MACLLFWGGLLGAVFAQEGLSAVGLPDDTVLVQEYWVDGAPRYWIANPQGVDIALTFRKAGASGGGPALIGPVRLAPRAIADVDARPVVGRDDLEVTVVDAGGEGAEAKPRTRRFRCRAPAAPRGRVDPGIVTYASLNDRGLRRTDLRITQRQDAFLSDAEFVLTVVVPAGVGRVEFRKAPALKGLPEATARGAGSEGPGVDETDGAVSIRADVRRGRERTARVRFRAPRVRSRSLAAVTGYLLTDSGGSVALTRGVIIEPRP